MRGKRLDAIEKLARDICWSGFSGDMCIGQTKAEYWRDISWVARSGYIADAKHLLHLVDRLGLERIVAAHTAARKNGASWT
ncbi:hypothetical protein CRBSH125_21600 [Afipia carboxidovorans]|nr:hypothetical protein CRBSH125_21600 [Afipia carboxidovorans]